MEASTPDSARPDRKLRWFQFRLRTLLIVVTLAGCGFAWLGVKVRAARQQAADIAAIEKLGGEVHYTYEFDPKGDPTVFKEPFAPKWLRSILGDDFFRNVFEVELSKTPVTGADLEHLAAFASLRRLQVYGTQLADADLDHLKRLVQLESLDLRETKITDAGLVHLEGLINLQMVDLWGTKVTNKGVQELQQALPIRLIIHLASAWLNSRLPS